MKIKLTILIAFLYLGSAFAAGHITKAQKEKTILSNSKVPWGIMLLA